MSVEENSNNTSGITKDGFIETEPALIPTANTAAAINVAGDDKNPSVDNGENKKKKRKKGGAFSFFRAALLVLRSDSKKKLAPKLVVEDKAKNKAKGNWKKIVGSMRPLHLQDNQSPPPSLPPTSPPPQRVESLEDLNNQMMMIQQQPSSPAPSTMSGGTMSQYASASNLQELDLEDDGEDDPDEVFDALCGDDMIDTKAEEFIAQFYQQMKLQHFDHAMSRHSRHQHHHHHYHHGG